MPTVEHCACGVAYSAPDLASAPVPEALTTILTMDGPYQE